jgi:hypothetical protein
MPIGQVLSLAAAAGTLIYIHQEHLTNIGLKAAMWLHNKIPRHCYSNVKYVARISDTHTQVYNVYKYSLESSIIYYIISDGDDVTFEVKNYEYFNSKSSFQTDPEKTPLDIKLYRADNTSIDDEIVATATCEIIGIMGPKMDMYAANAKELGIELTHTPNNVLRFISMLLGETVSKIEILCLDQSTLVLEFDCTKN